MNNKRWLLLALLIFLGLTQPALGEETARPNKVNVTKVRMAAGYAIRVGKTKQLNAKILPAKATDKRITWSSNNSDIASVSDSGLLTCHKVGKAVVTATAHNGKRARTTIKVTPIPATGVSVEEKRVSIPVGTKHEIKAFVLPDNATNQKLTYMSSNKRIATVSKQGIVTAKRTGKLTILIRTHNKKRIKLLVTVTKALPVPVAEVALDRNSLSLTVGDTHTLAASVSPSDAADKALTWSTENASIATVSNGIVTAKSAGETVIAATAPSGAKATCHVSVTKAVTLETLSSPVKRDGSCALAQEFKGNDHKGIDIFSYNSVAVDILAAESGKVESIYDKCAHNSASSSCSCNGRYGNRIKIQHSSGLCTMYSHLAPGTIKVKVGDTVNRGQVIAKMGATGNASAVHLHFEVNPSGDNKTYVNPRLYINYPALRTAIK